MLRLLISIFVLILSQAIIAAELVVTVKNPLNIERTEIVSVDFSKFSFNDVNNLKVFNSDKEIISQLTDSNLDGKVDGIIFQDKFKQNETKKYIVKETSLTTRFSSKTFVMFVEGREDIAWESNKVAYRMYGPPLSAEVNNGIDVWAKRVENLVVKKWYSEEEEGIKSYHVDGGEGADFFSVGKSLGCGGSALLIDDSLYQSGVYEKYQIVETGPIRAKFVLSYKFDVNGRSINEQKIISINADSYLNRIETSYSEIPINAKFVAGLVKRKNVTVDSDFDNLIISVWGDISQKKSDGELGIGLLFDDAISPEIIEDDNHILIKSDFKNNKAPLYFTGAGWSRQSDNFNKSNWIKYLKDYKIKLNNPLVVEVAEK